MTKKHKKLSRADINYNDMCYYRDKYWQHSDKIFSIIGDKTNGMTPEARKALLSYMFPPSKFMCATSENLIKVFDEPATSSAP